MSSVREFGAIGDGLHDDTHAVVQTLEHGDGSLLFPRGDYLLTRTVLVDLARHGRIGIDGTGGTARILMAGEGPAFHLSGTHDGTADPGSFRPEVWARERMPTVLNLEVEGRHPEADGFLVEGTMQSTFEGVLLRGLRHGIHIVDRARNVLISHCHIYHNSGVGVFMDELNLHQIIVSGCHISYCKRGGIKAVGSQIRNLQITGNDIEYNYDLDADTSADIWFDVTSEAATVREGTIAGNTIQAQRSPGGANILMVGRGPEVNNKVGMFAISGNLIGTQENNIRLVACRGVAITGNVVYSGHNRNLLVEHSQNVVVGANSFDHNLDYDPPHLCTGLRFENSADCILSGLTLQDERTEPHDGDGGMRRALLEIVRCRRMTLNGCQILNGYPDGLYLEDTDDVTVTGCTLTETREDRETGVAVRWTGSGEGNLLSGNRIGAGQAGAVEIDDGAGVRCEGNLIDD